jgi:hypothetical protein
MYRLLRVLFLAVCLFGLLFAAVWGTLALWYKAPGQTLAVWGLLVFYVGLALAGIAGLLGYASRRWLLAYAIVLAGLVGWWNTLQAPSDADWAPELARQVTGSIDEDTLMLNNLRAFEWRSAEDFTERWTDRSYDLSKLQSVDLFLSYWGGPAMAHYMLSFGFEGGDYLAWSIEVRRKSNDSFSPIADFFKAHSISIIASEERDVIGLRTNIRRENVHLFRLKMDDDAPRKLLEAYLKAANSVADRPRWFNSVFTNCSRTSILLARHAGIAVPMDWRIIVNGYMPDYLYELGALNTDIPLEELYRLSSISDRARAAGLSEGYSAEIRAGVSVP